MSLSGTGTSEWSTGLPRRSIRTDPPSSNPAVIAAGFSDLVDVDLINYAAARLGYDTEECIQKALEDDEIEMYQPSGGRRGYDVYRLTAKGRREANDHLRNVFRKSAEVARREYEEEMAENALSASPQRAAPAAAGAAS